MNYSSNDITYLRLALENSKKSKIEGNFPAGAVVVKDGEVISSAMSSPYPGLFHADSKAISEAFEKAGTLQGATLYIGLESCLMCTGVAYWSGLRRVVFAIPKSKVSSEYYEIPEETTALVSRFNEPLVLIHIPELQDDALLVVKEWEKEQRSS